MAEVQLSSPLGSLCAPEDMPPWSSSPRARAASPGNVADFRVDRAASFYGDWAASEFGLSAAGGPAGHDRGQNALTSSLLLEKMLRTSRRATMTTHQTLIAHKPASSYLQDVCPCWTIAVLCVTAIGLCLLSWADWPQYKYDGREQSKLGAQITIMGLVASITLLCNGVRPFLVFVSLLAVLSCLGYIEKQDVLAGFAKDGAWVPQLMLIIVRGIRESGMLDSILMCLIGRRRYRSPRLAFLNLFIAIAPLAAVLGAGPTVTVAAPLVTRWAKNNGFGMQPTMWVLIVAANVGNIMVLTSAPISMSIMQITCQDTILHFSVWYQTPLAVCIGLPLALYSILVTPSCMEKRESTAEEAAVQIDQGGVHRVESSATTVAGIQEEIARVLEERRTHGHMPLNQLELETKQVFYLLEFLVEDGSYVIGKTPSEATIRAEDGVYIQAIARLDRAQQLYQTRAESISALFESDFKRAASGGAAYASEGWNHASEAAEIDYWHFEAGDVIIARCSTVGVIAMRQKPGIFHLRGHHCHVRLGGRRHERRLYECVVGYGSSIVGQTLDELMGWTRDRLGSEGAESVRTRNTVPESSFLRQHRGFLLGGWRRTSSRLSPDAVLGDGLPPVSVPLATSTDRIAPGDVLLVDAFGDFPQLLCTRANFLVVSTIPDSQAPRHGRCIDKFRGVTAITLLVLAVILAQWQVLPLVVGSLTAAVILLIVQAVHVQQVTDVLNWPLLLTIGAGGSLSQALQRTGVAYAIHELFESLDRHFKGQKAKWIVLAIVGQMLGNTLSPVAAGLILAPAVTGIGRTAHDGHNAGGCGEKMNMGIFLIMSCNVALCTPYATPANALICRVGGFTQRKFMLYGCAASAVAVLVLVSWAEMVDL